MARQQSRKDYVERRRGSLARGSLTIEGARRVLHLERETPTCWRIAHQSVESYGEGYGNVPFHDGRCHDRGAVVRVAEKLFGPGAIPGATSPKARAGAKKHRR